MSLNDPIVSHANYIFTGAIMTLSIPRIPQHSDLITFLCHSLFSWLAYNYYYTHTYTHREGALRMYMSLCPHIVAYKWGYTVMGQINALESRAQAPPREELVRSDLCCLAPPPWLMK